MKLLPLMSKCRVLVLAVSRANAGPSCCGCLARVVVPQQHAPTDT